MPALTFTSPTPETLQSVAFCDGYSPDPSEDQERSTSKSLMHSDVSGSTSRGATLHLRQAHTQSFLFVPSKGQKADLGDRGKSNLKIHKRGQRLWSGTWNRLSQLFVFPQRTSTSESDTRPADPEARGRPARCNENQNWGASTLFGCAATGVRPGIGSVEASRSLNRTVEDISSRRRLSFGISSLVRRRLRTRQDSSKRYSAAF